MQEVYSIRIAPMRIAKVTLTEKRSRCGVKHWHIEMLHVPPEDRRGGYGTRLMETVIRDADAEGVKLTLDVKACASNDSDARLAAWYAGFGFEPSRGGELGLRMFRYPEGA